MGAVSTAETLESIMREHKEIRRELREVKRNADYANQNADQAHKRIELLERRMDDISTKLDSIDRSVVVQGERITSFDTKQDTFLSNQWQLIKYLLILLAGIITILGGMVGVKLTLPI
ncbi:hypothetical protein ACE41F_26575 [Bacillus cereus]|uniref:hypothetical protein n=1 Tax=Bacillus cereus TaxID=1396 RepID=UPI0035CBA52D